MRRPWPALLLLLGGALLLVSLYLPWQRASLDTSEYGGTREEFLHLFGGMDSWDGWYSEVAPAAALATLVLMALVAAALVRPGLEKRLPIGRTALIAAYFGVAVAFDMRSRSQLYGGTIELGDYHLGYGAYLGIAGGVALLAGAGLLRRQELLESRSLPAGVATMFVIGLLIAFLLPWYRFVEISQPGISVPAAQIAAAVALLIPGSVAGWRLGHPASVDRLGLALFAALFTGGAVASNFLYEREYGAWVGLAFAIALVALSLLDGLSVPDVHRMAWSRLVLAAVAVLFVTALFLPATEFCYPAGAVGPSAACFPQKAWPTLSGSTAGALAMGLIVHALLPERRWFSPLELSAGIGLLVTTYGFQFSKGEPAHLRYGFWIAAACAAVLVAVSFARTRIALDARLVPLSVCLVYLAVVVPPWWSLWDPNRMRWAFWFAPFSWLTITGALLCLMLMRLWLERREAALRILLTPMAMATLAVVDLARAEAITWGGGIVLALCGLLALCAFVEQRGGLGELRIPEILRVDRL